MPDRFDKAVNVLLLFGGKKAGIGYVCYYRNRYVVGWESSRFLAPNPNESAQRKRKLLPIQYSGLRIEKDKKNQKLYIFIPEYPIQHHLTLVVM